MRLGRRLLLPLTPIYAAAVWGGRLLLRRGWRRTKTLPEVVLSIGSVSAGGAGKTPFALLMANVLGRRGYAVRILSRGYGRASGEVERVDPAGDARRFGDEPMLLARRSGAPVYVGAERYRAGLMAGELRTGGTAVYLLDDGFQHRRLARDLDIVLLTSKDVDDRMLPAGDLREPLATIAEADVVVVREEEMGGLREFLSGLRCGGEAMPVWMIRRRLGLVAGGGAGLGLELGLGLEAGMPGRVLAFCGIARPESFLGMLAGAGCRPAAEVIFADHHRYGERDIVRLLARAEAVGADGFVTTEKDAVKLTEAMRRRLGGVGPVVIAELRTELVDEEGAVAQMLALVPRLNRMGDR